MTSSFETVIGDRVIHLEVGHVANLSQGAVTVRCGDTMVLVTVNAARQARPGIDFLPLTVDYEEKMYAAGKIPGSFFKREGRPSTEAILMARLTDRPLRPLFPKGMHNEVQVVATIQSVDGENPPDVLGILGASAALTISDIPFDDPIGACRIGYVDGEFVVNPTYEESDRSALDIVVAGTGDAIMMVEAGANEVSEDTAIQALRVAQEANSALVQTIREMQAKIGKTKWQIVEDASYDEVLAAAKAFASGKVKDALAMQGDKNTRLEQLSAIKSALLESLSEQFDENLLARAFDDIETEEVRDAILTDGRRPDGRKLNEIRPLSSEVGYLPRAHGSGLFTRGETQVLSVLTLGSVGEGQRIDSLTPVTRKYYMHHYNFPPSSVGEVGRMGTGRREIGHGALAERALKAVVPAIEEFPYTIRVVSDVLSSNGSTSMASVCGSTLALMDGGVPIRKPVAGIAMGLITGPNGEAAVLTDIQGAEDHSGDMDFKVAGTADGITALQMDIKVKGISFEIMDRALQQARDARLQILDHLAATIAGPRSDVSPYAPKMITIKVPVEKIGQVIGPGGKVIRGLIDKYGVTIDVSDDGTVVIGAANAASGDEVKTQIERLTRDIAVGDRFKGKVARIMAFGAFVELMPGKDGLVHISELSDDRVESVESVVSVGDELDVEVIEIDRMGRINLTARLGENGRRAPREPRGEPHAPSRRREEGESERRPPHRRRLVGGYSGDRPPREGGGGSHHDRPRPRRGH